MKTFDLPTRAVYLDEATYLLTRLTPEVSVPLGLGDVCVLELSPTADRKSITLALGLPKAVIYDSLLKRFERIPSMMMELAIAVGEFFEDEARDPYAIQWFKFNKRDKPHILAVESFVSQVRSHFLTSADGYGRYCTETHESDVRTDTDAIEEGEAPDPRFKFVVWFNK